MLDYAKRGQKGGPADGLEKALKPGRFASRAGLLAILLFGLMSQPACSQRKAKLETLQIQSGPVRLVLLPLNLPEGEKEQRWLAMAAAVLVGQLSTSAPDLEIVPLWESMPVTIEAVGQTRSITPELASFIAARLSAKWAAQGEISSDQENVALLLDFIPAKANLIPFRYNKHSSLGALGEGCAEALSQFLRYLTLRPLTSTEASKSDADALHEIADALDREYGWFRKAEPGQAGSIAGDLFHKDVRLAGVLFNPALYRNSGTSRPGTAPQSRVTDPAPASPDPTAGHSSPKPQANRNVYQNVEPAAASAKGAGQPEVAGPAALSRTAAAPLPISTPENTPFEMPPPRSFTQRWNVRTSLAATKKESSETSRSARASEAETPSARNKASPERYQRGVVIQVFSSRQKAAAEMVAARLESKGWTANIEEGDLKERGTWYRIRLGGYESLQSAQAAGKKMQENGLIKEFWVIR